MAQENVSIKRFQKYLQINTMHPNPNYAPAFEFLRKEAEDIGLEFKILPNEILKGSMAVMTWRGTKPEMKSILLSSHIDVVPVFPEHWKYDPFSGHKDEEGNIYARGAQDMKCVTIWYLEAIRKLIADGKRFARTVHLFFTTDEEIHNAFLKEFCASKKIYDFNIAFGLDEGIANPGEKMKVFYGERSILWVEVICGGQPGHGSQFLENTAGPKLQYMINRFYEFREEQEQKLKKNPEAGIGSVTTVNLSMLKGGVQGNVVPAELRAVFDIRIPPTEDFVALENKINQWATDAGSDVRINFLLNVQATEMVRLDEKNKFWMAFRGACQTSSIEIQTGIFPASTDSGFYRHAGIDMLGFSPMNQTPILLHDHNEFLNENVFLRGIDIYYNIISSLASVED